MATLNGLGEIKETPAARRKVWPALALQKAAENQSDTKRDRPREGVLPTRKKRAKNGITTR